MTLLPPTTAPALSHRRRLALTWALLVACLVAALHGADPAMAGSVASDVPRSGPAAQIPEVPARGEDRSIRVQDDADVLTDEQEEDLNGDLARLRNLGVEALVFTRETAANGERSQEFADQLRTTWGVETHPGADNGIVYLITVDPSNPESSTVVASTGENTFPIRQLDAARLQEIVETEMQPAVANEDIVTALNFGIRRVINYADYTPPDPRPLTPTQDRLNGIGTILGAIVLQAAIVGFFLVPGIREHRLTLTPSTKSLAIYAIALAGLAVATGLISIAGRSGFGSLAALVTVVWACCGVPLLGEWLSRRSDPDPGSDEVPDQATSNLGTMGVANG